MTTVGTNDLDVRGVSPRERDPRVLVAFDALPEEGSLVLVDDQDPRPLLSRFQDERRGQFEWSPLEEGPEVWRIAVTRRRAACGGETVSGFLAGDHDRLDGLMAGAGDLLRGGRRGEAARRFAEFRTGLLRHIRMEEEILFPAFERATGMSEGGPTAVMRAEHIRIRALLEQILEILADPAVPVARFDPARSELLEVLLAHNQKEEHAVYPMTDRLLPPREREGIVQRMRTV